jgi:glutamate carboxypeptidase
MRGSRLGPALAAAALVCARGAVAAPRAETDAVAAAAAAARPGALALLQTLVNVDSGTGDVAGGRKVLAILKERLSAIGAEVSEAPAEAAGLPPALVARLHGAGRGRVLLIGHLDTVFGPGVAAARPYASDGARAHGPGVGDEKGGVAAAVTALSMLHGLGWRDYAEIVLLIDNSEERGSPGTRRLISKLASASDVELNLEPGDPPDALTVWRKGSASIRIHVKGRAAHAGIAPQDGRNAALELIHQLDEIKGRFPSAGPETTVNLTLMRAGERNNIIPDDAEATLNVRFRSQAAFAAVAEAVKADAQSVEIAGTEASVVVDPSFPPLADDASTLGLARRAQDIYKEIGRTLALSGNGGASESALAQGVGTPALDGLGFVGGDFHTDHEWIDLGSVEPRLYLLARLIMEVGARPPARDLR